MAPRWSLTVWNPEQHELEGKLSFPAPFLQFGVKAQGRELGAFFLSLLGPPKEQWAGRQPGGPLEEERGACGGRGGAVTLRGWQLFPLPSPELEEGGILCACFPIAPTSCCPPLLVEVRGGTPGPWGSHALRGHHVQRLECSLPCFPGLRSQPLVPGGFRYVPNIFPLQQSYNSAQRKDATSSPRGSPLLQLLSLSVRECFSGAGLNSPPRPPGHRHLSSFTPALRWRASRSPPSLAPARGSSEAGGAHACSSGAFAWALKGDDPGSLCPWRPAPPPTSETPFFPHISCLRLLLRLPSAGRLIS